MSGWSARHYAVLRKGCVQSMIVIPGGRAESVLSQLTTDVERRVWQAKYRSARTYVYRSEQELRFELKARDRIVNASYAMNASGVSFASFADARCNPRFWRLTEAGGFLLRPGVSPADGIRDIFQNGYLYAFECAVAIVILFYRAVLDLLGDALFNRLYSGLLLYSWHTDSDLRLVVSHGVEVFPGDVLYFANPDVSPATPEFQGENAVVLAEDVYFGHGIGIASASQIILALNRMRRPGATRSAYLADEVVTLNFRYFADLAEGMPTAAGMRELPGWMAAGDSFAVIGSRLHAGI